MLAYLYVFIGGGLGSICRFGIGQALVAYKLTFPLATLLANIFSCIILGMLVGMSIRGDLSMNQRNLLMGGFCGGFSTFSTFTNETFQLFQIGEHFLAITNILSSLLVCLLCIYIGLKIIGT